MTGHEHPGKILDRWLMLHKVPIRSAALAMKLSPTTIANICNGRNNITANIALRLERYEGTDARTWLHLQSQYDLQEVKKIHKNDLAKIKKHIST
jgi:addiction module HigA family antidote